MTKLWHSNPSGDQERLAHYLSLHLQTKGIRPEASSAMAINLLGTLQKALDGGCLDIACDSIKSNWIREIAFWELNHEGQNPKQVQRLHDCIETVDTLYREPVERL